MPIFHFVTYLIYSFKKMRNWAMGVGILLGVMKHEAQEHPNRHLFHSKDCGSATILFFTSLLFLASLQNFKKVLRYCC